MILAINCSSSELNSIMYIIRSIMNLIMIIAPILAIISFSVLLTKKVINPDDKKIISKIKNAFHALLIIFFIPAIVTCLMYALGDNTEISSCYLSAKSPKYSSEFIPTEEEEVKESVVIVNDDKYEKGNIHQLDFSCKSNYIKAQFSCDTIHIVEHHYKDFNYYTKDKVISSYGGFDKWIDSLGGYFKEYYMKDVKEVTRAAEFQKISEYVFGLMYIHGFDYYNSNTLDEYDEETHYCKWGGGCFLLKDLAAAKKEAEENHTEINFKFPQGTDDAFYPGDMIYGDHGYMNSKNFDQAISGKLMTTNCNTSVDMVYYKAKILGTSKRPYGSANVAAQAKDKNNKIITDFKNLQIGDILHFYNQKVDPGKPSTWKGWKHVAYVGEINYKTGVITAYDGGSYFMNNRNHKWTFNRNKTTSSLAGYEGWSAIRVIDLK